MSKTVPYTWKVGVDNAFGYLTRPDGAHLVESRRFLSGVGLAVSLSDGGALLTPADGKATWQPVPPVRACELAGIPGPGVDGAAETARRTDPFHVERHTSPLFLTLVALAHENALPCGHAMRAWLAGAWDGTFDGPYLEQPETFAASVIERIARTNATPQEVALAQVVEETLLVGSAAADVPAQCGWAAVIGEIPARVGHFAARLDRDRSAQRSADQAGSDQLELM
jgi:hypothetical protein